MKTMNGSLVRWLFVATVLVFVFAVIRADRCSYSLKAKNESLFTCEGDRCAELRDPISLIIEEKRCKTNVLSLSFSRYESFRSFRKNLSWPLTDLFRSTWIDGEDRHLILYFDELHSIDQPSAYDQLLLLGPHLDLLTIFFRKISSDHHLRQSIQIHPTASQWSFVQVTM